MMSFVWQEHGSLCADGDNGLVRLLRTSSACICLVLALVGCASVPSQPAAALDFTLPESWTATDISTTGGASQLPQWWSQFNDPLLTNLVARALQSNTSVRSAEAALRQARALRDVSAAALWPALGGSASVGRSKSGRAPAVNGFQVGLDASWELDIFGANRSARDAAEATALASGATLGDVQVSIAAEVALDYIVLRSAQARLIIATDNLASQQETLQLTQWRLQAGLVSSLETEQALAAAEQTRASLPLLQTSIEQAEHALSVLTGQPPAALQAVLAVAAPVPQAAEGLTLGIPAETLRQRPDVRAAEYAVTAAQARVAEASAARMPDFALSGSLGQSAATVGALSGGGATAAALLAGVTLPLFDGGALRAQVHAQQAALDQSHFSYQATVLAALTDVEDALTALRGDRERLLRLQGSAQAARNAALMARQRYGSGLVDFQVVLDTQRTQLSTQDSVAISLADVSADHVRLYKALGGSWRPDSDDSSDTMPAPNGKNANRISTP